MDYETFNSRGCRAQRFRSPVGGLLNSKLTGRNRQLDNRH